MFLGIEIGGTKLQFGIGPGDGTLLEFHRIAADATGGAGAILRQVKAEGWRLLHGAKTPISAVGIGFGGPVDDSTRRVLKSHQVSGWAAFPLAEWAEEQFHMPAVLGNDADVAGLAEALFGAGKGFDPIFYTNVGSGIGGALIINGHIYRGCGKGAGEIGHLWSKYDPMKMEAGDIANSWRIVEHCSSGWAMARNIGMSSAEEVATAAKAGDANALHVLQEARRRYAVAISHVIALFCPRRIVLGGGVALMDESLWLKPLREEVARIAFAPFADCYDIVPAALGEEVVVHGAIALARTKI